MASWDTPVVSAPKTADYAAPLVNFSAIANLPEDFAKGKQMAREEEKANLFRNGIPRVGGGQTGDYDLDKIATQAAKVGGLDYAKPFIDMQVGAQNSRAAQQGADQADSIAAGSPSAQPTTQPLGAPKPSPRVVTPAPNGTAASAPVDSQPTVMKILAAQGIPNDQLQAASDSVARQLGVSPTDVINTNDPQVRNVLGPAIQRLKGIGQVVQPSAAAAVPQAAQETAPQTPNQRVADGTPTASAFDTTKAENLEKASAYQRKLALGNAQINPKLAETQNKKADDFSAQAKLIREQVGTEAQPAPSIKEWRQSGSKLPYDEWVSSSAADKATSEERAKADVKEQQTYIDAGKQAGSRLTTLNTIGNIVNNDKNLTLGFGADTALKLKMALQQFGIPVGDLSGAEGIQKMNAALASEMAKSLSGRPTQFEFKSFMANNPGLLLDKSGNQRLIGIYSQLAKREYELGKLARQNGDNWSKWDDKVEEYDGKHPIIDPISKQPISTNSVIAPGPDKPPAATQAAGAPKDGATAINPKTGERLMLQGGKWMPFT